MNFNVFTMLFKNRGKAIAHTNKNTATNANAKDTPIPDIHRRTNKTNIIKNEASPIPKLINV